MAKKPAIKQPAQPRINYILNGNNISAAIDKMSPRQILISNKINPDENILICIGKQSRRPYTTLPQQLALVNLSGKTFISEKK